MDNRQTVIDIRNDLRELLNKEAMRLYRQARRMQSHKVKAEEVTKCREEANELYNTGYPERVLDPFKAWDYAFRYSAKDRNCVI